MLLGRVIFLGDRVLVYYFPMDLELLVPFGIYYVLQENISSVMNLSVGHAELFLISEY